MENLTLDVLDPGMLRITGNTEVSWNRLEMSVLPVLRQQRQSMAAHLPRFGREKTSVSTLLVRAESQTVHPFFRLRVCNCTSPSKRDVEPAVQLHSEKELPLLRSENSE